MYIDEEVVKVQMELIRASKETFKSLPDPIFSFVDGEEVIRNTLTEYIHD